MQQLPKIIRYKTLDECFDAFTYGRLRRCDKISGHYATGEPYTMYVRTFLKRRRCLHCWGWYQRASNRIHLWFDGKVKFVNLLELISHELRHSQQHKNTPRQMKEKDAGDVSDLVLGSVSIAAQMLEEYTNRKTPWSRLRNCVEVDFI